MIFEQFPNILSAFPEASCSASPEPNILLSSPLLAPRAWGLPVRTLTLQKHPAALVESTCGFSSSAFTSSSSTASLGHPGISHPLKLVMLRGTACLHSILGVYVSNRVMPDSPSAPQPCCRSLASPFPLSIARIPGTSKTLVPLCSAGRWRAAKPACSALRLS